MRVLTFDDLEIQLPGSWAELSLKQLRFLAKMCLRGASEKEVKLNMLLFCAGCRVVKHVTVSDLTESYLVKHKRRVFNIDCFVFNEIISAFDFLFNIIDTDDEKANNQRLYITPNGLINNPLPKIKVLFRSLYGVGDALYNLTMSEFSIIEINRDLYVRKHDVLALHKMVSILYRLPGNVDGDNRCPLSSKIADKGYWRVKFIKPEDKLIIYWFYTGVLLHLTERFPRTFSGDGTGAKGNVYDEMSRLINSLASGDMTKKNLVRDGLLWDALYSIEDTMEQAEKMEK